MNNLVEIESVEQVTEAEEVQKKKKTERERERELNFLYFTNLIMID
jgi:hypothetical protein